MGRERKTHHIYYTSLGLDLTHSIVLFLETNIIGIVPSSSLLHLRGVVYGQ
jgi:hypothetical protein